MGIFKRLFSISEWDRLPPRFTQLLIRTLGENDFKVMDGLAKKHNIFSQNIFKDRKIYEDEPEYALELFGGFMGSMGSNLTRRSNYEDAEKALLISLKLKPRENPYRGSLAVIYSQTGRWQEARHEAQQALETMEGLERLMANIPIPAEIAPEGPEDDKQEYKDLLIKIIETAENINREGGLEAIAAFREAVRLGTTLLVQGQFAEAEKVFREAIRLKLDDAEAYFGFGTTLLVQGQFAEAEKVFREAIRLKPDHAEALENLAITLDDFEFKSEKGKQKEARRYWERAEKLEKRPEWVERIKRRLAEPD